jgi:hypothetical protein
MAKGSSPGSSARARPHGSAPSRQPTTEALLLFLPHASSTNSPPLPLRPPCRPSLLSPPSVRAVPSARPARRDHRRRAAHVAGHPQDDPHPPQPSHAVPGGGHQRFDACGPRGELCPGKPMLSNTVLSSWRLPRSKLSRRSGPCSSIGRHRPAVDAAVLCWGYLSLTADVCNGAARALALATPGAYRRRGEGVLMLAGREGAPERWA